MTEFLRHNLLSPVLEEARGGVVAIGNFDGVHKGHQVVLETARKTAEKLNTHCYALSFEPHPRTLFRPQSPVFRLTPEPMKARILQVDDIDGLLTLPFTRELAATGAEDFVDRFLLENAGAAHIVSGFNFHFGKDRAGSPEFLVETGQKKGFGVTIVKAVMGDGEEPVSSSRIRRLLGAGKVNEAAQLLDYRWLVSGEVVEGAQLGRTLGYPTANLVLSDSCHLSHGIYAVRVRRADGQLYDGVASYGRRPTFDDGPTLFETFIFDFDDDLYGETLEVSLFEYLRGEHKFETPEALVDQMDKDALQARAVLKKVTPVSELDSRLSFKN